MSSLPHRFNPSPEPIRTVESVECRQSRESQSRDQVECPRCQKSYVGASIVSDRKKNGALDLQVDFARRRTYVVRRAFCDHCDHILLWEQICSADGQLGPVITTKPGVLKSRAAINSFLRAHPEAAGVSQ